MKSASRREMLKAGSAAGLVTAVAMAGAHAGEPTPQPHRPGFGGTNPAPHNVVLDRRNPDLLAPPATDEGTLPNLRFPFSDAHTKLATGGWTRRVTVPFAMGHCIENAGSTPLRFLELPVVPA
jgi:oxalate decarboxylase